MQEFKGELYLVGDAWVSVLDFVLGDVEDVVLGHVLPELCRALADEVADPATELAGATGPPVKGHPGRKIAHH